MKRDWKRMLLAVGCGVLLMSRTASADQPEAWGADANAHALHQLLLVPGTAAFAVTAAPADAFAVFMNAASVAFVEDRRAIGGSAAWMEDDVSMYAVSGHGALNASHHLLAAARFFRRKPYDVPCVDAYERPSGSLRMTPQEGVVDLGYALRLSEVQALAVTVRWMVVDAGGPFRQAGALGVDFSWMLDAGWNASHRVHWQYGARVANVGSRLDMGGEPVEQPMRLSAGVLLESAAGCGRAFRYAVDAGYSLSPRQGRSADASTGVWYRPAPAFMLGVNGRYVFDFKEYALSCDVRVACRRLTFAGGWTFAGNDVLRSGCCTASCTFLFPSEKKK